jgi:hypothetical protein
MSEQVAEKKLTDVLAEFELSGQTAQATSICRRFLRKIEIRGQAEAEQSQIVHAAILRRDRGILRDYMEFSVCPDIRECSKAVLDQIDATVAPISKWPVL